MELFDFVKNKKTELTEEQLKWNKMWEMWANEQVDSPYAELMTYQSEIYNGGHSQYFTNVSNTNDLKKEMLSLETILPSQLRETLKIAYEAYLVLEENDDEKAEQIIEQCDDRFYENEEEINRILKEYAAKIEL